MARQMATPAVPSTPAQRDRYDRILQAATAMLEAGGEDVLQMKELCQKAGVSLSALYRYFPSKDHVLLAIAVDRFERSYQRSLAKAPLGDSARDRVTNRLLREFRAEQRNPKLTAALARVLADTSPGYTDVREHLEHTHIKTLRAVAEAGGPLTEQQRRALPIVIQIFIAASRRWLAGIISASDARFEIRMGCRLLDVPSELIDSDLEQAAPADTYTRV